MSAFFWLHEVSCSRILAKFYSKLPSLAIASYDVSYVKFHVPCLSKCKCLLHSGNLALICFETPRSAICVQLYSLSHGKYFTKIYIFLKHAFNVSHFTDRTTIYKISRQRFFLLNEAKPKLLMKHLPQWYQLNVKKNPFLHWLSALHT